MIISLLLHVNFAFSLVQQNVRLLSNLGLHCHFLNQFSQCSFDRIYFLSLNRGYVENWNSYLIKPYIVQNPKIMSIFNFSVLDMEFNLSISPFLDFNLCPRKWFLSLYSNTGQFSVRKIVPIPYCPFFKTEKIEI